MRVLFVCAVAAAAQVGPFTRVGPVAAAQVNLIPNAFIQDANANGSVFGDGAGEAAPTSPKEKIEAPQPPSAVPPKDADTAVHPPAAPAVVVKLPEPSKEKQASSLKVIKEVYAERYKKKEIADRLDLARKLIEAARLGGDDASTRFTMLIEARDIAAGAGDVATIQSAIGLINSLFIVNESAMTMDALSIAAKQPLEPDRATDVANALLTICETSITAGDLDAALSAVTKAELIAKRSKEDEIAARATARVKDVRALKTQFGGLAAAKQKLKTAGDDPQANALVGKYLCLVQGAWDDGLAKLVKGNDPILQKAAELDLKAKANPDDLEGAGASWAAAAERLDGIAKVHVQQRAEFLYKQALSGGVAGLRRIKIERQVALLQDAIAAKGPVDKKTGAGKAADSAQANPVLRALEALMKASPPKMRVQAGQKFDPVPLTEWMESEKSHFRVDGTFKLVEARVPGDLNSASSYALIYCENVGPVTVDGVDYSLRCVFTIKDKHLWADLSTLTAGTSFQVKGTAAFLSIDRYATTTEGGAHPTTTIAVTMENPVMTVKRSKTPAAKPK